jgi:hypothetical protein
MKGWVKEELLSKASLSSSEFMIASQDINCAMFQCVLEIRGCHVLLDAAIRYFMIFLVIVAICPNAKKKKSMMSVQVNCWSAWLNLQT